MSAILDIDFICIQAERPGKRKAMVMTADSDTIAKFVLGLVLQGYAVKLATMDEYDAFASDHHYRTLVGKSSVIRYKVAHDDPSLDDSSPDPNDIY